MNYGEIMGAGLLILASFMLLWWFVEGWDQEK